MQNTTDLPPPKQCRTRPPCIRGSTDTFQNNYENAWGTTMDPGICGRETHRRPHHQLDTCDCMKENGHCPATHTVLVLQAQGLALSTPASKPDIVKRERRTARESQIDLSRQSLSETSFRASKCERKLMFLCLQLLTALNRTH